MTRVFTLTVLVSAALLFTIEPLVGKLLLPLAGGTPAVWTTCMLFFQAALLAGYAYAFAAPGAVGVRRHALAHLALVIVPVALLPIAINQSMAVQSTWPALSLLRVLVLTVGLPFFVIATSAPLLQRWFAAAEPKRDPYPLYAASNAGSLIALLSYPLLIEPSLTLNEQRRYWAYGYWAYAGLMAVCAVFTYRRGVEFTGPAPTAKSADDDPVGRWLLLSFAPSSLLLGVTTYLSTDITPWPLLWVIPLALYLLTFILAFAGRPLVPLRAVQYSLPVCACALFFTLLFEAREPWWLVGLIHLGTFVVAALACHGELARIKPPPERLTRFYLWVSVGGLLGGVLNALIAPVLFQKVGLAEYPLVVALACALLPRRPRPAELRHIPELAGWRSYAYPAIVVGIAVALFWLGGYVGRSDTMVVGVFIGLPLVLIYPLVDRPRRFAAGLVMIWLACYSFVGRGDERLFFERNFFGSLRVGIDPETGAHRIEHGTTVHGMQFWKDGRGVNEPLTYYGREGPAGDLFAALPGVKSVAVCGLGAGSLAAYARPGQAWTFFEIDPAVVRVALDPHLFTFLADNFPRGEDRPIVFGDARLELERFPDRHFDLIVLDAFSSDAIPVHLLTKEAIDRYRRKLTAKGVLAFHISNRYLDLKPVLAAAADELKMHHLFRFEPPEEVPAGSGRLGSVWAVLADDPANFGDLNTRMFWRKLDRRDGFRAWTDDYSNLIGVFFQ